MTPAEILIIDLDPQACPDDHSKQLARLLGEGLPKQMIDARVVNRVPPQTFSPPPDVIVLRPSKITSLSEATQIIRRRWSPVSILGLFCSEKDSPSLLGQFLRKELDDFLTCPFRAIDVLPRVQRFLFDKSLTPAAPQAAQGNAQLPIEGVVGESGPFLRVLQSVPEIARSGATVLISGETGTGKELIARAIHYHSPRRGKPFIPVNCGALPDNLVENELFGHVKGAYTDASSLELGLVAEAEQGTLFLDEVDTLSPFAQAKLLRFLQHHEYRPLGSAKSHTADVRIIAATNADLQQEVQARRFREDLYYRLNILGLHLPSLRERVEDIPLLAAHFLRRYGHHHGREPLHFAADALHKLVAYPWPGNVRELESVIQRAVILAASHVLQPEDLDLPFSLQSAVSEAETFREAKARTIAQFERTYLINLLAAHQGNVSRAAKQAGEVRRSLQRLLKRHGLNRRPLQS